MYSNHELVKVFNGEKKSIEQFTTYNDTLYKSTWKAQFLSGLMQPIMEFVGNARLCGCLRNGWILCEPWHDNGWKYSKFYSIYEKIYSGQLRNLLMSAICYNP